MRAALINQYGGPEVIQVTDIDRPNPKSDQVLVEVHAASINPFDFKLRQGYMKNMIPLTFPMTIGMDVSGVVTEIPEGGSGLAVGDEVYGSAIVLNGGSGAIAEFAAVNSANLAIKPSTVNHPQAASLVLVGVSALQALDKLNLNADSKLLIHGGAGGIGSCAIQYAKHLGAHVTTTVREKDVEFVIALGADEADDFEKHNFDESTGNYDAVYDNVGGEVYERSFKVLKRGGTVISMTEQPNEQLAAECGVTALFQSSQVDNSSLSQLSELVENGVITPQVDQEFPLDQVVEAFRQLEQGHHRGKIVLKIK